MKRIVIPLVSAVFPTLAFAPHLEGWGVPINNIVNAFLGMLLQALPFLLIGVLLSSAIQIFIPRESLERHMSKSLFGGMFFMLLSGFILPVYDCASVPVFRSMVKNGVPLHLAVVFFAASPVINPVVMLSTYYAFCGDKAKAACFPAACTGGVFLCRALPDHRRADCECDPVVFLDALYGKNRRRASAIGHDLLRGGSLPPSVSSVNTMARVNSSRTTGTAWKEH